MRNTAESDAKFEAYLKDQPEDYQAKMRVYRQEYVERRNAKIAEATEPFPFDEKTTLEILREPMIASWCHPLANLATKLVVHHKAVNEEPFMIGGVERDEAGASKGVVSACFYGTVRFTPDEIIVYSNWGEGNMCPEKMVNLAAIHPAPAAYKALYSQLEAIADEQMQIGCTDYNPPKKVKLRLPHPSEDLTPGL